MLAVASEHAMEGKDLDVLNEMSADGSGSNGAQAEGGTTLIIDDHIVHLQAYSSYLSLGFKAISTVANLCSNGWLDYCHH